MKTQKMTIDYGEHDHINLSWIYNYCPLCGKYLPSNGWRMAGGNEKHSSYLDKTIIGGDKYIFGVQINEKPRDIAPLLFGDKIIMFLGDSLGCYDIKTSESSWVTEPLGGKLGFFSTPILLRPFLLIAMEDKLLKVNPPNNLEVVENYEIGETGMIPVSFEKDGLKKAFFPFGNRMLICEMKTGTPELRTDWINFDDNIVIHSPVIYEQQVFVTSSNGIIYTISDGKPIKVISLGNGEFSSPMLLDTINGVWIVLEAFNDDKHRIYAYHLDTGNQITIDLEQVNNDPISDNYKKERLAMCPIQSGSSQVAVSSYNNKELYFVDIAAQKYVRESLNNPIYHWKALGTKDGVVSIIEEKLQCVRPRGGCISLSDDIGEMQRPFHILANNNYLVIVNGNILFRKEV